MSKVNFLKQGHRLEIAQRSVLCGIIDGPNEIPAYTTTDTSLKWNATINNPKEREFQFVPIDYNIIVYKSGSKDKESTCDGMLLVKDLSMIAFVELKDDRSHGFSRAIEQLKNTIRLFHENHRYDVFRIRRAYAANIRRPYFHYNMKDEMENFRAIKFVFYPEATIQIN